MRFGSLFAGIGGIDLGLERAGMECSWQVEIDPYCAKVLEKHWPNVRRYGDVKTIDWSAVEPVDLVCGGFPCQPVSLAGRRGGQSDARWLWPEFVRCIRDIRPRYVLVENVPGLLAGTREFGEILGDLVAGGYDAEWDCLPAAAFGAPHLRYRVFLVAYSPGSQCDTGSEVPGEFPGGHADRQESNHAHRPGEDVADPNQQGELQSGGVVAKERKWVRDGSTNVADAKVFSQRESNHKTDSQPNNGQTWSLLGSGSWWNIEPDVGRVAYGIPARVDRLRALGNAVVPQVAEWVGRQILAFDRQTHVPG